MAQESEDSPISVMRGYLYQTAITPESYVITNPEELKAFVSMLPPVTPYKNLPAPPNPDPLLKGYSIDFSQDILVVAVGRNRIDRHPTFLATKEYEDGTRQVWWSLSAPTSQAYPYGWAVYSAVIMPKTTGTTSVTVQTLKPDSKGRNR